MTLPRSDFLTINGANLYYELAGTGHPLIMVIVGSEDQPSLHEIADMITTQIPGARKVIIPGAGHHPNVEHPVLFNQVVQSFLQHL
jgi:hypothetical protein